MKKVTAWICPVVGLVLLAASAQQWPTPWLTGFLWPPYAAGVVLLVTAIVSGKVRHLGVAALVAPLPLAFSASHGLSAATAQALALAPESTPRIIAEGARNLGVGLFVAGVVGAAFGSVLFARGQRRETGAAALFLVGSLCAGAAAGLQQMAAPLFAFQSLSSGEKLELLQTSEAILSRGVVVGGIIGVLIAVGLVLDARRHERVVGAVPLASSIALAVIAVAVALPFFTFTSAAQSWSVEPPRLKGRAVRHPPEAQWSTSTPPTPMLGRRAVLVDAALTLGDVRRILRSSTGENELTVSLAGRGDDEPWPMTCASKLAPLRLLCSAVDSARLVEIPLRFVRRLPPPGQPPSIHSTDKGQFGRPAHAGPATAGTVLRYGRGPFTRTDLKDLVIYDIPDDARDNRIEVGFGPVYAAIPDDTRLVDVVARYAGAFVLLELPSDDELSRWQALPPAPRFLYETTLVTRVDKLQIGATGVGRIGVATPKSIAAMLQKVAPKLLACLDEQYRKSAFPSTDALSFGINVSERKGEPPRCTADNACLEEVLCRQQWPRVAGESAYIGGALVVTHTVKSDPPEPGLPTEPLPPPPVATNTYVTLEAAEIGVDLNTPGIHSGPRIVRREVSGKLTEANLRQQMASLETRIAKCLDSDNGRRFDEGENRIVADYTFPSDWEPRPTWRVLDANNAERCIQNLLRAIKFPKPDPRTSVQVSYIERHSRPVVANPR